MKNSIATLSIVGAMFLFLILGCGFFPKPADSGITINVNSNQSSGTITVDLRPYKGSLKDLLPAKLSGTFSDFVLADVQPQSAKTDAAGKGYKEIVFFSYQVKDKTASSLRRADDLQVERAMFWQTAPGAGTTTKVFGNLMNLDSEASAETLFNFIRSNYGANAVVKTRKNGKEAIHPQGTELVWINGSLVCVLKRGSIKDMSDFTVSAPF